MSGVEIIAAERQRQIDVEGYTETHDIVHNTDALARAAACYAMPARLRSLHLGERFTGPPSAWPWSDESWKPCPPIENGGGYWTRANADQRIRELAKAGALIAAEIDRLQAVTL